MKWLRGKLRSQERGATTDSTSRTLNSGNPGKIRKLMREHLVVNTQSSPSGRYKVEETTGNFGDEWRPGRRLGWLRPHRIRRFEITPDANGPLSADFIPLSRNQRGGGDTWAQDLNNAQRAVDNTQGITMTGGLGVTGQLSGCSIIRKNNGEVGHLQPPSIPDDPTRPIPGVRAEQALRSSTNAADIFGPGDYGRGRDTGHIKSNALLVRSRSGSRHLVSQSVFSAPATAGDSLLRDRRRRIVAARRRF